MARSRKFPAHEPAPRAHPALRAHGHRTFSTASPAPTPSNQLVRLLYERDWDKHRILRLFSVLDWMMQLPKDLEAKLWQDIEDIEGERKVRYVTSVERLATERGMQQGMQQGMEKGMEQGIVKGEGNILRRVLTRRFGPLPQNVLDRLARADAEQLEVWADRVIDATNLDEVFAED